MDKYEFNIKIEQIKKLVSKGDYETAMKIADTIDWRRVRNANLLSMVAQVYEKNEEYSEAKDILLLAFERAPIGKRLLYKLAELAIKENNIEEAEAYYREFCDLASDDSRQHLLRYMILKEKGAPAEQLIHSLEQYTAQELDEKWMYELAALYHEAGYGEECVRTCDKIMLMFGIGKYVDKAMHLKTEYQPLTSYQMDLVENRDKYEAKLRAVENGYDISEEYEEGQLEEAAAAEPEMSVQPPEKAEAIPAEESAAADLEKEEEKAPEDRDNWDEASAPSIDKVLAAKMKEAEEEEKLAKQMAGISADAYEEEPSEKTKVLTDIKSVFPAPERQSLQGSRLTEEEKARQEASITIQEPENNDDDMIIEELWEDEEETAVNHLMIEARTPEEGLDMALEALRKIHKETGTRQVVAKITGSKLNKKGIFAVADKIQGKDLVVEEAGDLNPDVLNELNEFMEKDETGVIVVLIDNPRQMEELHMKNPKLARKFECIGSQKEDGGEDDLNAVEEAVKRQAQKEEKLAKAAVVRPAASEAREERKAYREDDGYDDGYAREEYSEEEDYPEEEEYPEEEYSEEEYSEEEYSEEEYSEEEDSEEDYSEDEPAYDDRRSPSDEKEMDIDEFAEYACKYAGDIDCSITGKSMLALYERIEIMEEEGIPLTKKNAEDLIEEAADKAEKPSLGKLITGVFSPKYNKDGLLILKEEHFI